MFEKTLNKKEYTAYMDGLSRMLELYYSTLNSAPYKLGARIISKKKKIKNAFNEIILRSKLEDNQIQTYEYDTPNYFSDQRIAVYTCFFGNYDTLENPICTPDNIDYYVITDQLIPNGSIWKKVDISLYENILKGYSNVEKNRWFKMFPDKVFSDYRYSVYVDGNVVPVTDFTEFINKIGNPGIAMYNHSTNNCVYQEALYNKYRIKKISAKDVDKQVAHLKKEGMPIHYGMTTCNVIARDHYSPISQKLMENWWEEFMNGCRRDQLSFPFVVWKNGIAMKDIARLGPDVWSSKALYVKRHTN